MTALSTLSLLVILFAAAQVPGASTGGPSGDVTLRTRTTFTFQDSNGNHPGRGFSRTIYIHGNRQRYDDDWDTFEVAPSDATSVIEQWDLRRTIFLSRKARTYDIVAYPDEAAERAQQERTEKTLADLKSGKLKARQFPPDAPVITIETNDTGERKQVAGFTLRHLVQVETHPVSPDSRPAALLSRTRDGWYLDLPPRRPTVKPGRTFALLTYGMDKNARLEARGNASPSLPAPVEETHISKYADGDSYLEKTELLELSSAAVDPSLFEIPRDYRQALVTEGAIHMDQPDTLLNRLRAWWRSVRLKGWGI